MMGSVKSITRSTEPSTGTLRVQPFRLLERFSIRCVQQKVNLVNVKRMCFLCPVHDAPMLIRANIDVNMGGDSMSNFLPLI